MEVNEVVWAIQVAVVLGIAFVTGYQYRKHEEGDE